MASAAPVSPPLSARVGDRLPSAVLGPRPARRLDATAVLVPGRGSVADYAAGLAARSDDFAAWDGVVVTLEPTGNGPHRLLVVDRYRQVYAVHEADSTDGLPSADELAEWFRFLATACPECGVIDDPMLSGPTL